jgi:hypothetical protein
MRYKEVISQYKTKKPFFFIFSLSFVCKSVKILVCLQAGKRKPPAGEGLAENRTSRASRPSLRISRYTQKPIFWQ